jgi:SAM-dependent methyltransferase
VYDDWYGESPTVASSDLDTTIATLDALANGGRVFELGVGTGRLAIPLAATGLEVHGLDASAAMLAQMSAKPGAEKVIQHLGDMAGPLPSGPFSLIFIAINTFFNLTTVEAQQACLTAIAAVLEPDGVVAIEAFVPDPRANGPVLSVRSVDLGGVTLVASNTDVTTQSVIGQIIELRDGQLPRLKAWQIRYASPEQLDTLADAAGLLLAYRWGSWAADVFDDTSTHHVSVYMSGRGVKPTEVA